MAQTLDDFRLSIKTKSRLCLACTPAGEVQLHMLIEFTEFSNAIVEYEVLLDGKVVPTPLGRGNGSSASRLYFNLREALGD